MYIKIVELYFFTIHKASDPFPSPFLAYFPFLNSKEFKK